jgi:hypothetical protein
MPKPVVMPPLDDLRRRFARRLPADLPHLRRELHRAAKRLRRRPHVIHGCIRHACANLRGTVHVATSGPGQHGDAYGRRPLPADHIWALQRTTSSSRQASEQ